MHQAIRGRAEANVTKVESLLVMTVAATAQGQVQFYVQFHFISVLVDYYTPFSASSDLAVAKVYHFGIQALATAANSMSLPAALPSRSQLGFTSRERLSKPAHKLAAAQVFAKAVPQPKGGPSAASKSSSSNLASVLVGSSSSCDALESEDFVYSAVPLRRAAALQHHQVGCPTQQLHYPDLHLQQLSLAAAEHCYPWLAAAYLAAAVGLLAAPQQAVQLFGAAGSAGMGAAVDPLLVSFAQLLGGAYLLQSAVPWVVKVCMRTKRLCVMYAVAASWLQAWQLVVSDVISTFPTCLQWASRVSRLLLDIWALHLLNVCDMFSASSAGLC